jgi:phosphatidylserine/phosphatidylglycerophosphate/cardiolipin synthase-like enzyme
VVKRKRRSTWLSKGFKLLLLVLVAVGVWHSFKPLPEGISYAGELRPALGVQFLADLTFLDAAGERHSEQQIFDELFAMIDAAQRFVLVDMFLFNAAQGRVREEHRALASELTSRLILQQERYPDMQILLITDPINSVYGGLEPENLSRLRQANISVTETKLTPLRDSNPIYSSIWRTFLAVWGNGLGEALPNPVGEGRVSVRSYLTLMNFKANHRKVAITDQGDAYTGLVTSANPHDGSSAHGNVALRFSGPAVADLLASEVAVLKMSGGPLPAIEIPTEIDSDESALSSTLQVVTEGAIEQVLLETIAKAQSGDSLDLAVFYLSDRDIVEALKDALQRDVDLRVLLDPNKDAFGRTKNGIPNRQTAHELVDAGAKVRWCDTHGEQCHSKLLLAQYGDATSRLILGSANYTRRNLDNLNLETSVVLEGQNQLPAFRQVAGWFELRWSNAQNLQFSLQYSAYADEGLWHRLRYRVMEASGISTF